jgi:hypothetical protein
MNCRHRIPESEAVPELKMIPPPSCPQIAVYPVLDQPSRTVQGQPGLLREAPSAGDPSVSVVFPVVALIIGLTMMRLERSFRTALAGRLRGTRRLTDAPVRGLRLSGGVANTPSGGDSQGHPS